MTNIKKSATKKINRDHNFNVKENDFKPSKILVCILRSNTIQSNTSVTIHM